jgi:hypothetical protein
MNPRTLTLMMALLLGGCTSISYEAGREVSDVPAGIDTIRLDEVAPVGVLFVGKAEENIDTTPSENDVEVLAAVRAALVKDFAAAGIAVVEGNDRPAPVSMRVYVSYQPERWPLVLRNVTVYLHLFDQDGWLLFRADHGRGSVTVAQSMVQTRDEFVGGAMEVVVEDTVAELRKGMKRVVLTARAAPPPAPAVTAAPSPAAPTAAAASPSAPPAAPASSSTAAAMVTAAPAATAPVSAPQEGYDGHWLATGAFPPGGATFVLPCAGYKVEFVVTGNKLEANLPTNHITTHVVATISPDGSFTSTVGAYGISLSGEFSGDTVDVDLHSGICPRTPGKGHRIS